MPRIWRRRYGAYIRRGDSVGGSGWRSAGALHPGGARFLGTSSPRAAIGLDECASPERRAPVGAPAPGANSLAGSMNECSCCTADELVLVPPGDAPARRERSWSSWSCRSTRPGCDQPGTPAGSMNECSCRTADELVLVPSGGAPGRVASTARRRMRADNAGVARLRYTPESVSPAGGQQFDLVAVGVFDEGEAAGDVHHGPGFAHDLAAGGLALFAGLVDIIHFDGDVTVAGTQVVAGSVPVVGQLQHGVLGFVTVADEGQGKTPFGVILAAQQGHAQYFGIEGDGFFQVAHAEHGVQNAHGVSPQVGSRQQIARHSFQSRPGDLNGAGSADQISLRPLLAAMRRRSAFSLMKPAASA